MFTQQQSFAHSFNKLFFRKLDPSQVGIRPGRFRYMLIFSLAPLFANLQNLFLDQSLPVFGLDSMTWMGVSYCVGAGILFALISPKKIVFFSRLYAVVSFVFFLFWYFLGSSPVGVLFAVLFSIFFGGCAALAALFLHMLSGALKDF
ncbi:MAG TPA: hypothetical protein GX733_08105 [Tissierellia bacterium]|nr:hypothetical protein [Tissierellia bacterium]